MKNKCQLISLYLILLLLQQKYTCCFGKKNKKYTCCYMRQLVWLWFTSMKLRHLVSKYLIRNFDVHKFWPEIFWVNQAGPFLWLAKGDKSLKILLKSKDKSEGLICLVITIKVFMSNIDFLKIWCTNKI